MPTNITTSIYEYELWSWGTVQTWRHTKMLRGKASGAVAYWCIIPTPLQRHWNNVLVRHRLGRIAWAWCHVWTAPWERNLQNFNQTWHDRHHDQHHVHTQEKTMQNKQPACQLAWPVPNVHTTNRHIPVKMYWHDGHNQHLSGVSTLLFIWSSYKMDTYNNGLW